MALRFASRSASAAGLSIRIRLMRGKRIASSGFVPAAGVDGIERDLEHESLLNFTHRSKALDCVGADPAVEPFQFLIGKSEIGFPDGKKFILIAPATKGIVAVIARSFPRAPLPRT